MADSNELICGQLYVNVESADSSKIFSDTQDLKSQLKALIYSVNAGTEGDRPAEEHSKGMEIATIGTLAVAIAPLVLPEFFKLLQAWAQRGQGRTVEFEYKARKGKLIKVKVSGDVSPNKLKEYIEAAMEVVED